MDQQQLNKRLTIIHHQEFHRLVHLARSRCKGWRDGISSGKTSKIMLKKFLGWSKMNQTSHRPAHQTNIKCYKTRSFQMNNRTSHSITKYHSRSTETAQILTNRHRFKVIKCQKSTHPKNKGRWQIIKMRPQIWKSLNRLDLNGLG